ncbi:MAG: AAA family ATPase [Fimbriiglobus sp.]
MLSRVAITNYRSFQSYRLGGLAQVNLLVGKNNCGKTAILEAIQFLATGGAAEVLQEIAERRGEQVFADRSSSTPSVDVQHLFYGHEVRAGTCFRVEGDNGYLPVSAKISFMNGYDRFRASPLSNHSTHVGMIEIGGSLLGVDYTRQYYINASGAAFFDGPAVPSAATYSEQPHSDSPITEPRPVRMLSTDLLNTGQLGVFLDEININQQEANLISALKLLDSRIESISIATGSNPIAFLRTRAGVVVGLEGQKKRVPLGSLGDGTRRILSIAASLECAKDGMVLADEIDSGLHYSMMQNMWKMVIERAVASNTQVFATTHSWDCIEALSLLCQEEPGLQDRVAVQKITRSMDHSISFRGDSVARMERHHIDPR